MSKDSNPGEEAAQSSPYSSFQISKLENSRYVSPYRINFDHNGKKRIWDGIMSHASVSCVIYNTDKQCIILVRQFRPVVYVNRVLESHDITHATNSMLETELNWSKVHPNEAYTYELCAGICDKNKSLEETIKEEILEECGYEVDLKGVHKVSATRVGVGLLGSLHTIFYAEVNEEMKKGPGGGNVDEGESIELFELHKDNVREFIMDDSNPRPPGNMST